jgi:hypothetical protein
MFAYVSNASACIVRYRNATELKSEANLVVQATITSKQIKHQSQIGELYSYLVKINKIVRGNFEIGKTIEVTYYNVRARVHKGKMECPFKEGSGLEMNLNIGESYRFFIKGDNNTKILYTEELSNRL